MLIQFLLIVAVALLLLFFLRNHGSARASAGAKIGFVLFLVFGVIAVLRPDDVTRLAGLFGVGRGTDLVLYGMVVAFGFATINTYLRFKAVELRYARLARSIALRSAESPEPGDEHDGTLHRS
ncbi:hypothetical protein SAMN05421810_107220 [Amycolatopsis arida]|uniref:DUF2304 domain-containing protein n=1 Tax=Amycolatopsis arida TaxID=587909 RepID=A0A1I5YJZ8_9PSEU|nr:DUF2304 domain-containing protein [Amycolatopsis arida]TDX90573.1 hypothetical protein CLV69_107220 [Amycolatopsis arida]SFQ44543.1 hypothetical protein SAMN05421810_107220 [Amycolatopsis arida]